jgi:glycosyltransferase involved in cell wall biosynthesis
MASILPEIAMNQKANKAEGIYLSVIIPAYNEEELLPSTLEALQYALHTAVEPSTSEIIVCNNQSTDKTAEIASEMGAIVVSEARRNIASVRNTGARAACGEWLLFIDADSTINLELLMDTLTHMEDPKVAGGGSHLRVEGLPTHISNMVGMWNRISSLFRVAAGSYVFCSREDFESVGGFDEEYYAGEELFFSRKLKRLARRNKRRFVILHRYPLLTSSRRMTSPWNVRELIQLLLVLFGFRFLLKNRNNCGYWYNVER